MILQVTRVMMIQAPWLLGMYFVLWAFSQMQVRIIIILMRRFIVSLQFICLEEKHLVITANASDKNIYIKSCKVNGKSWNRAIIEHGEIANGGTIEMELSDVPTEWGKELE